MIVALLVMLGFLVVLISVIFNISQELKEEKRANAELHQSNLDLLNLNENLAKECDYLNKQLGYRGE